MGGTVNIVRDLWDDPTFKDSEMSQREAWIWLIADASWKPREKRVGDYAVKLQRGQLAASTRFLAAAWMWSEARVRRFLDMLVDRRMISKNTDAGITVVTICNYDRYQNPRRSNGDVSAQPATQLGRTSDANQNKGEIREEDSDAIASDGKPNKPTKAVFDEGVKVLVKCGVSERNARNFLGKIRKDNPGKDSQILEAIMDCSKIGAVDPVAFITACLRPKPPSRHFDLTNFGNPIQ